MKNHQISLSQLTEEQLLWFAELSAGAVMSEGDIQDEKLRRIGEVFNLLEPKTAAERKVTATLMLTAPPKLTPMDFSEKTAKEIYRFILYISLSSLLMGQRAVIYIFEAARVLLIDRVLMKEMIHSFILELKHQHFIGLATQLPPPAQQWLCSATLKVILANGKADRQQMTHLSHVQELLDFNPDRFKKLREGLASFQISSLDNASLTTKTRLNIFSYLTVTSLLESGFDLKGLNAAKQIGNHLELSEKQQLAMVNKIKNFTLIL